MAECVRVPFLLLFAFIAVNVCPIRGDNAGFKAVGNDVINPPVRPGAPAEADRSPVVRAGGPAEADRSPVVGAGGPVEADRSPVVGASPPRRHSAPWKLAEEAACRDDLTRLCPKHSWNNNLAVLECLLVLELNHTVGSGRAVQPSSNPTRMGVNSVRMHNGVLVVGLAGSRLSLVRLQRSSRF